MMNDEYFINKAKEISLLSQDNRTKVGVCICDKEHKKIISLGTNNPPKGFENSMTWELGEDLNNKHLYVVHAELNAILNSKRDLTDCIIYTTLFPCNECAKTIIQSGIKEVIYIDDKYNKKNKYIASKKMFDVCGIKYRRYKK